MREHRRDRSHRRRDRVRRDHRRGDDRTGGGDAPEIELGHEVVDERSETRFRVGMDADPVAGSQLVQVRTARFAIGDENGNDELPHAVGDSQLLDQLVGRIRMV
jgi:hypothetical protein